jgi:predicted extracellular nuclease
VIASDDPAVIYAAYLVEGNDVGGIDTGYLVRDTVNVLAVTQLAAGEILSVDGSLLHDRPPLQLDAEYVGGGGAFEFTVIALHQRSLSGIESPSDGPRVRQKRLEQAQSVAQIVQDFQTSSPSTPLLVVGDFNAFEFTDGYVDVIGQIRGDVDPAENLLSAPPITDPGLVNEVLGVPAENRYSFVFDGSAQVLDHVLSSHAAVPFTSGFAFARGNADAPRILLDSCDGVGAPDELPLRASDHDGGVVYLLNDPAFIVFADGFESGDTSAWSTAVP